MITNVYETINTMITETQEVIHIEYLYLRSSLYIFALLRIWFALDKLVVVDISWLKLLSGV